MRKRLWWLAAAIISCLQMTSCHPKKTPFTKYCQAIKVTPYPVLDKKIATPKHLPTNKTAIFLIKNISNNDILIDKLKKNNLGADAGWLSLLSPNKSSALSISKKMQLQCLTKKLKQIGCQKKISICIVNNTSKNKNIGNYWITENANSNKIKHIIN